MDKSGQRPSVKKSKKLGINSLQRELSDDEDDPDMTPIPSDNSDASWRPEFRKYLDVIQKLPEGMTPIQWWGVSPLSIAGMLQTRLIYSVVQSGSLPRLGIARSRLSLDYGIFCFK
jgi:hypothetical protein